MTSSDPPQIIATHKQGAALTIPEAVTSDPLFIFFLTFLLFPFLIIYLRAYLPGITYRPSYLDLRPALGTIPPCHHKILSVQLLTVHLLKLIRFLAALDSEETRHCR